jgi:hypothetical protein
MYADEEEDDNPMVCAECHWMGTSEELVSQTDDLDDNDFSFCPNCGGATKRMDD